MTNEENLKNITVSVAWCGAEPTLIRKVKGGEKYEINPGESMDVEVELAKDYKGAFLINASDEEIKALTKSNAVKRKADIEREKANAKVRAESESVKAEARKADEEDLEDIDEEDGEGEIKIEEMSKKDCKDYLDGLGVEYPANAKIDELRELVRTEASNELHGEEEETATEESDVENEAEGAEDEEDGEGEAEADEETAEEGEEEEKAE